MATSLAFNEQFYLQQNPDVVAAIARGQFANAQQHFNLNGRFEGRDPNAFFDTSFYLSQYPDVLNARANPLEHFLNFGAAEGRFANATIDAAIDSDGNNFANEFNADAYLAANPDLAAAVGPGKAFATPFQHFTLFGQFESRPGTPAGGPFTNTGTAPGTGQTITLTTAIDGLNGTNANDQFNAVIDGSNSTLQTGDSLNGGQGTDTLRIVASTATTASDAPVATLRSIENINVAATADTVLNLTDATGVQNVTLTGLTSGTDLTVNGLSNIVTLGATNTSTGASSDVASVTAAYAASAVSGSADVQNIVVNNASATTFSVNGIESFAVNAASGKNSVTLTSDVAVNTVTVAGAGSLAIDNTLANTVTTFDASKATGAVSATFAAGGDVKATGGAGNDVFNFVGTGTSGSSAGLTTKDTVNGGAGFDTVVVGAGNYSAPIAAAAFNGLTSIERVTFSDATSSTPPETTVNGATFTNTGITNLKFDTAGNDIINNAGSARTYEFGTGNDGDATFNLNATTTSINVALLGTTDTGDADVEAIAVNLNASQPTTAVSTINLSSQGTLAAGTVNNVGTITAVAGSTVNVTGSGALDLAGFANRATIDASAHTGGIVVEGSNFTAAASGTDFVSGADVITLGSGRDTVQFTTALASGVINATTTATEAQGPIVDTINSFTAGANGDILDFGAAGDPNVGYTALAGSVQTDINNNAVTLLDAANIAVANSTAAGATSSVGAGIWTAFSFGGETYAVYDAAQLASGASGPETYVSGTDLLVRLAGVNVADLTAANFA